MRAEIAVIGGSGIYSVAVLRGAKTTVVRTPFGDTPEIIIGELKGRKVAFLPRHGKDHTVPPHLVNYRANLWALHKLGVGRVLATTACGTINPRMRPGDLCLLTQFMDFTKCRPLTFYEGGKDGVVHIDVSEPYCPELRGVLTDIAKKLGFRLHPNATYACMEGPRFETAAEIKALRKLGSDLVGMTNVPECVLARELGMCYATVGIVSNFAAGISKTKLTHADIIKLMGKNIKRVQRLLLDAIPKIPKARSCPCCRALEGAAVRV